MEKKLIDKDALVAEIEKQRNAYICEPSKYKILSRILSFIDTLEVKEVDLELEIDNNNSKITVGTKIRSKTNPDLILSIISNDCHEDEFECSNGSVLSLKQIEKYYDIYVEER